MRSVDIIAFPSIEEHASPSNRGGSSDEEDDLRESELKGPSVPRINRGNILNRISKKLKKVKTSNQLSNDRHPMTITVYQIGQDSFFSFGGTIYDIWFAHEQTKLTLLMKPSLTFQN